MRIHKTLRVLLYNKIIQRITTENMRYGLLHILFECVKNGFKQEDAGREDTKILMGLECAYCAIANQIMIRTFNSDWCLKTPVIF